MLICFFIGLLITGGFSTDGDPRTSAEVWLPGDRSCQLPRLPAPGREGHTQSSYTACGGEETLFSSGLTSCLSFDGEWEQSHSLSERRRYHVSWQSPAGILLMGGYSYSFNYSTTTELLSTTTDTTTSSFSLPYHTE